MERNFTWLAAAAVAALPAVAQAQSVEGTATLSYGMGSIDDIDYTATGIGLEGSFDAGNGFGVDAAFGLVKYDDDSDPFDLTMLSIAPTYSFGGGFKAGVYYSKLQFDDDAGNELSVDSQGVILGYDSGMVDAEFFYGKSDESPEIPGDEDWTDMGVNVVYSMSDQMTVGGSIARTRLEVGSNSADFTSFGLAGAYDLGTINIFGGFSRSSVDEGPFDLELTSYGIGAGYDLGALSGFDSNISLEFLKTTANAGGGDLDSDEIRLGVSIPLGGGATVPQGSAASQVLNGPRSALSSALLGLF